VASLFLSAAADVGVPLIGSSHPRVAASGFFFVGRRSRWVLLNRSPTVFFFSQNRKPNCRCVELVDLYFPFINSSLHVDENLTCISCWSAVSKYRYGWGVSLPVSEVF
jgi:hypothetical protein